MDIFLLDLTIKLPKNIRINEYSIELIYAKLPLYRPIYILSLVKLETLKTYIKTYLKTGLIWISKSLAGVPILFDKKSNNNLYLYVNYQSLNALAIQNQNRLS